MDARDLVNLKIPKYLKKMRSADSGDSGVSAIGEQKRQSSEFKDLHRQRRVFKKKPSTIHSAHDSKARKKRRETAMERNKETAKWIDEAAQRRKAEKGNK